MKAAEILIEEHKVIKCVLQCLIKIIAEAEKDNALNLEAAQTTTDLLKEFADCCHHSKEEDSLFPVMEANGIPKEGGPIGVMLTEHVAARSFIGGMRDSMEEAAAGKEEDLNTFLLNAKQYIELLHQHIDKEDHCLYPMADQALSEQSKTDLLEDFKKIEEAAGGCRHKQSIKQAKELCLKYDVMFVDDEQLSTIASELS